MPRDFEYLYRCLGQIVCERRKRLNMTQLDLSKSSGLGRVFISNVEQGTRQASFGAIDKIAYGLGMKTSSLIRLCERKMENAS